MVLGPREITTIKNIEDREDELNEKRSPSRLHFVLTSSNVRGGHRGTLTFVDVLYGEKVYFGTVLGFIKEAQGKRVSLVVTIVE